MFKKFFQKVFTKIGVMHMYGVYVDLSVYMSQYKCRVKSWSQTSDSRVQQAASINRHSLLIGLSSSLV